MSPALVAVLMTSALLAAAPVAARSPADEVVTVDEHLGARVPAELSFTDAQGRVVRLGDVLGAGKPVVLVLAYYHCPMLCGLVLRGAAAALQQLRFQPGADYRVVTVSFDPADDAEAAARAQRTSLDLLNRGHDPGTWPFLVGDAHAVAALTGALGFPTYRDPTTGEYAHPAVIFVLTPDGTISRYLYGIQFDPRDLKLSLLEASAGRIGTTLDRVIMRCFVYDPAERRYGLYVSGSLRVGALAIFVALAGLLFRLWHRERRGHASARLVRDRGGGVS